MFPGILLLQYMRDLDSPSFYHEGISRNKFWRTILGSTDFAQRSFSKNCEAF